MQRDATPEQAGQLRDASPPAWMRAGFWICIVIAVAVVIRRLVALAHPTRSAPPQLSQLDAVFQSHAVLTLAHILPALAFVLIAPLIYLRRFSDAVWPERLLFPLGAIVGITAYSMSAYAVGGWVEISAVLFFNTLFLYSLFRARGYSRRGDDRAETALAHAGDCHSSGHCYDAAGDGRILRHQRVDPPYAATVLWLRFLDRLFDQHARSRALAAVQQESRLILRPTQKGIRAESASAMRRFGCGCYALNRRTMPRQAAQYDISDPV